MIVDQASIYQSSGVGDIDWFVIKSTDSNINLVNPFDNNYCIPFTDQCLTFYLEFELPSQGDFGAYQLCINHVEETNQCGFLETFCLDDVDVEYNAGRKTYYMAMEWSGECGFDNSRYFNIEIKTQDQNLCAPYTIRMYTELSNDSCPDRNSEEEEESE